MKTLYRLCFLTDEADTGAVLRRLLAMVKSVQVLAPTGHDGTAPARYGLFATFGKLPTAAEINAIRLAGGALSEESEAGLLAARRAAHPNVEADIDRLMEAGEVKREAVQRARRRTT